jgi:glycerol-3-phosphate dehydrogenase (NAD(P)+)
MEGSSEEACAVLGAGSWGTALAILLARQGRPVRLWGHLQAEIDHLRRDRSNEQYLPGIPFPEPLDCTADLGAALEGAPLILVAVPSHAFASVLEAVKPLLRRGQRVAWATKGLETGTGRFLHQVFADILGKSMAPALISGPTFAREVAQGLPTAVTVASPDADFADQLAHWLSGPDFRAYTSNDVQGAELGGAVKNVMAIAAGISDGLGFGANSRAALITRGLHEIMRLGETLGGQRETFMGLAGVGDLVLTCTDDQSRNRRLGWPWVGASNATRPSRPSARRWKGCTRPAKWWSWRAATGWRCPSANRCAGYCSRIMIPGRRCMSSWDVP